MFRQYFHELLAVPTVARRAMSPIETDSGLTQGFWLDRLRFRGKPSRSS